MYDHQPAQNKMNGIKKKKFKGRQEKRKERQKIKLKR